jgi:hypothetical protein
MLQIVTYWKKYKRICTLNCAVFSLEPRTWDLIVEIIDPRCVNLVTLLCCRPSALPGAWDCSSRQHSGLAVWAVNLVKLTFRPGCEIWFRRILRLGQRFRAGSVWVKWCYWYTHTHTHTHHIYIVTWSQPEALEIILYEISWFYYFLYYCLLNQIAC